MNFVKGDHGEVRPPAAFGFPHLLAHDPNVSILNVPGAVLEDVRKQFGMIGISNVYAKLEFHETEEAVYFMQRLPAFGSTPRTSDDYLTCAASALLRIPKKRPLGTEYVSALDILLYQPRNFTTHPDMSRTIWHFEVIQAIEGFPWHYFAQPGTVAFDFDEANIITKARANAHNLFRGYMNFFQAKPRASSALAKARPEAAKVEKGNVTSLLGKLSRSKKT
jgi:hypothetical protein